MELDFDAAEKVVDLEEGGAARKTLDGLNAAVTTLGGLQDSAAELAEIDALVTAAKARDHAMRKVGAANLHALLKDALAVVNSAEWHDPKVCPVCEKAGDAPLQDQLEAKIAAYDEADQLHAELKWQVQSAGCIGKLRQLEVQARLGVADADRIAPVLILAARQSTVSTADLERAKDALGALETIRVDVLAAINGEIATLPACRRRWSPSAPWAVNDRHATGGSPESTSGAIPERGSDRYRGAVRPALPRIQARPDYHPFGDSGATRLRDAGRQAHSVHLRGCDYGGGLALSSGGGDAFYPLNRLPISRITACRRSWRTSQPL